jgi:hypothetical protein
VLHRLEPYAKTAEWVFPLSLAVAILVMARWKELSARLSGRRQPEVMKQIVK